MKQVTIENITVLVKEALCQLVACCTRSRMSVFRKEHRFEMGLFTVHCSMWLRLIR